MEGCDKLHYVGSEYQEVRATMKMLLLEGKADPSIRVHIDPLRSTMPSECSVSNSWTDQTYQIEDTVDGALHLLAPEIPYLGWIY